MKTPLILVQLFFLEHLCDLYYDVLRCPFFFIIGRFSGLTLCSQRTPLIGLFLFFPFPGLNFMGGFPFSYHCGWLVDISWISRFVFSLVHFSGGLDCFLNGTTLFEVYNWEFLYI